MNDPVKLPGFAWSDLFDPDGLARLDAAFMADVAGADPELAARVDAWRGGAPLAAAELSALLIAAAPRLEAFVARLFGVEAEVRALRDAARRHDAVLEFKKQFVMRRARRYRKPVTDAFASLDAWLRAEIGDASADEEAAVAAFALALLADADARADAVDRLTQWCVRCLKDADAQRRVRGWVSFRLPQPVDPLRLIPLTRLDADRLERLAAPVGRLRPRDGFDLTDPRMTAREVQAEATYCVYCHDHDGDSCSKGFPEKKGEPALRRDAFGAPLAGCPLEEKISEMNALQAGGHPLAALAVAMIDNPMLPATGHRICDDCMKACVYQKQEPVDIPQIETRVLTDALRLPWGVEIYGLLTRWHPLRPAQPRLRPANGRRALVVGMGPAGFAMAHHLTLEGCAVMGVDRLAVRGLPEALLRAPVRDFAALAAPLSAAEADGFGGVPGYNIPARWDRNFLKLIHLELRRRPTFTLRGGVDFGASMALEDAWAQGFGHVVLAVGAGAPKTLAVPGADQCGVLPAGDFLTRLRLRPETVPPLRLPALVVGGGLTAIDAATEAQACYLRQAEQALARFEADGNAVDGADADAAAELLAHGRQARAERRAAAREGRAPDFIALLRAWGGVTVVARGALADSPAYARNHGEIAHALSEGVLYLEGLEAARVEADADGRVAELVCRRRGRDAETGEWRTADAEVRIPARTVLVAVGVAPNTDYERLRPGAFAVRDGHYQPHEPDGAALAPVVPPAHAKASPAGLFTSYRMDGRRVTFLGDAHPSFHGNVVKALASAARSWPQVLRALEQHGTADGA